MAWVQTAPNAEPYGGCEELEPILGLYFDVLWERGEHPYYGEESELAEWLAEQPRLAASAIRCR